MKTICISGDENLTPTDELIRSVATEELFQYVAGHIHKSNDLVAIVRTSTTQLAIWDRMSLLPHLHMESVKQLISQPPPLDPLLPNGFAFWLVIIEDRDGQVAALTTPMTFRIDRLGQQNVN